MNIIFKSILFITLFMVSGCVTPSKAQTTPAVSKHYIDPGKTIDEYISRGSLVFCDSDQNLCVINVCIDNDEVDLPSLIFKRYYPARKSTLIVTQVGCTQASLESSQIF